jgi:hypothetical protein
MYTYTCTRKKRRGYYNIYENIWSIYENSVKVAETNSEDNCMLLIEALETLEKSKNEEK